MMKQASSLLSQVNDLFSEREKQLEMAESDLRQKAEALQKEKAIMAKLPVADNDILTLNVGGTILVTKRATLIQAEGSALAARFSGNWEQCLDHDEQGRIFLDFDPEFFQHILFYLRARMLKSPDGNIPYPKIEQHKQQAFRDLVKYLALNDYMGCTAMQTLRFLAAHPSVKLQKQVATAEGDPTVAYRSISVGPLVGNNCYMKCKIHKMQHWMFFGIAADVDVAAPGNNLAHFSHASSFGWGAAQQQYIAGRSSACPACTVVPGDCVLLRADFVGHRLSLITTQVSSAIELPLTMMQVMRQKGFFHVILYSPKDSVELLPVTSKDHRRGLL